jgi:hypothetical protein
MTCSLLVFCPCDKISDINYLKEGGLLLAHSCLALCTWVEIMVVETCSKDASSPYGGWEAERGRDWDPSITFQSKSLVTHFLQSHPAS